MEKEMVMWIILLLYLAVMIGIGVYCRKMAGSVQNFVLGGRNLGPWFTAFAYGTSYFSAVVFIGYAGQFGWNYGVASTWVGIGNALIGSLLAWWLLGNRTRLMSRHLNATTMPEFFEKRYHSKGLKIASALIVFIFLIPYTASVYNGLSRLFEEAFGIDYLYCIIGMAVLTAIYVVLGGYTATAINDFIQGIIMLIGIAAVVIFAVNGQGGLFTALTNLGKISDVGVPENSLNSLFGPDPLNLLGVVILTSLGTWALPQMVQKFYAIKDKPAVTRGAVISTIFALVVAGGSYFLGGLGRLYVDDFASYDDIVPDMLGQALPDILMGVVVVLVLSASMSTLSSLVLTSSSTLTIDLIKPFRKNMKEKTQVLWIRILIVVFIVISVVIAANKTTLITSLMSVSWGTLAGAFLGPFLYGLYSKRVSRASVWTAFVVGVVFTVGHMVLFNLGLFPDLVAAVQGLNCPLNLVSPINAGAAAMLISLILVPVVSLFTKKQPDEELEQIFSCIKKEKKAKAK